ncbi:hypothetical protein PF008_g25630 [Phytophthora fragariae]|uniref:RxLR effector protein n=1 Tax=Phytophthora fragariae TaxID=53985 RepID=A0A6G0QJI7_9STRA|nr:hypothetical protein PF008_g25630 [Phytophthora fragariae]
MQCSFGIFFCLLLRANCSSQAVQPSVATAGGPPRSFLTHLRVTVFPVTSFVCICELVVLAISSFIDGARNHSSYAT